MKGNSGRLSFFWAMSLTVMLIAHSAAAFAAAPPAREDADKALTAAMKLMAEKKYAEANALLKAAIKADPSNTLLWAAYDSCVRSEALKPPESVNAAEKDPGTEKPPRDNDGAPAAAAVESAGFTSENSIAAGKGSEDEALVSILETDFTGGSPSGDLNCILNSSFRFIKSDISSYLMLDPKEKSGVVTFSFPIGRNYPKKIRLDLTHRLVKKDRFTASAPVTVAVNDSRTTCEDVKLGNKVETTSFDITNFCRNGANIVTIGVEKSRTPYLLKNVKLIQTFKD